MTTGNRLIMLVSLFLVLFANLAFFKNTLELYPPAAGNTLFLVSLFVVFLCVNIVFLSVVAIGRLLKPVLILFLLIAASSAYFMDSYNIVIDKNMLDNVAATDLREARDLFSFQLVLYLLFLWLLPSIIIYKLKVKKLTLKRAVIAKSLILVICLAVVLGNVLLFSKYYTSFVREHRILRSYATPIYPLYSSIKFLRRHFTTANVPLTPLGTDARTPPTDGSRELIVLVIGESARADHFSLNGYPRKTNPLLEKEQLVSFTNVWSCGTSTAESVPCMFSYLTQKEYSKEKSSRLENVLDILHHAGVSIHWLDNNSSSKGVARRFVSEDYRVPGENPVCDTECRDEGMLAHLEEKINAHTSGDILLVLHQMGSHGPDYYKRYPKRFEKFKPGCYSNQLEQCSEAEIINSYDNTILYTDYFLAKIIELLKQYDETFEAGLVYISDHGESLGENRLYLHGMPYVIAPDSQKSVPLIMWFNSRLYAEDINYNSLKASAGNRYSHDNLFHTLLGIFEISSEVYDPDLDIANHNIANHNID